MNLPVIRLSTSSSELLLVTTLFIIFGLADTASAQSGGNDKPKPPKTEKEAKKKTADKGAQSETPKSAKGKAKNGEPQTEESTETAGKATTIFAHSDTSRFYLTGQINFIYQQHGRFRSPYSGENSFRAVRENAASRVLTLYAGAQITKFTEVFLNIESAGGRGVSDALGFAGATNLDVVRNPTLGSKPYLARFMFRQIIPLSKETVKSSRGALSLATSLPAKRLEFRFGKFSTVDFFDVNSIGSDSHLQFMNWTVDNNGAYDYAADTRGYTYGGIVEYQTKNYGVRYGLMLMPKIANGLNLDANVKRARGENLEFEIRHSLLPFVPQRAGVLRLLSYVNHANMGSYREAIDAYLAGRETVPTIELHRRQGRVKYGFGVNFEQELSGDVRAFGRFGWNEGKNESFAYTEVNQTFAIGGDVRGTRYKRCLDKIGFAFVSNAISGDHRRYLQLGGKGFLLGDGTLNYGRENIFETYYTAHLWRGVFASFDLQRIVNPGYNRDRGPVFVPGARLHIDF